MLDFQQKRKAKSFMYSKFTIGVLFVLVLFAIHSTWVVYRKQVESQYLRDISKKKVGELKEREKDLNNKIQMLDTEQGIEKEIRSKFNVVKGDENMVVVVDDSDPSGSSTAQTNVSFWTKIKLLFTRGKW